MSCSKCKCGVCLQPKEVLLDPSEADSSGESWTSKLQFIVPEVEWNNCLKICTDCTQKTDQICQFRRMCIEIDKERQQMALSTQDSDDDDEIGHFEEERIDFSCSKCGKLFENQQRYEDHTLTCKVQLYGCFHCNRKFRSKTILAKHIRNKHKQAPDLIEQQEDERYTCIKCNKVCVSQKAFEKHSDECKGAQQMHADLDADTRNVSFECDVCHKFYTTSKIMKAHRKKCIVKLNGEVCKKERKSSRIFSCEVCDKEMNFVKLIVDHCVRDHAMDPKLVKPYSCSECTMRFSSSANLIQHKQYHEGIRTHICSFCGKTYITKSDLKVHEYTHFNRRNYKCEPCSKAFNTNKNLRSHILVVHTDRSQWKYLCSCCGKRFPLKSGHELHMRRHTGDKRFPCHICNKHFFSRTDLKRHIDSHTAARSFKCEHCDRNYKEKRLFDLHLLKAHNVSDARSPVSVKEIICPLCAKTFKNNQKLKLHMCVHASNLSFECTLCVEKFKDKSDLKKHLKKVHDVLQPKEETVGQALKEEDVDIEYNMGIKYANFEVKGVEVPTA